MAEFDPNAFTPFRGFLHMLVSRALIRPFFLVYKRVRITGRENVPRQGPLLVVSNHLSELDPPLIQAALDRPVAFLAKEELFRVPGLRAFIKFAGAISLNRAHPGLGTFKEAKAVLKSGWALSVFIEGTRNRTPGSLRRPHLGPAYIAGLADVPILPVGIVGTDKPWGRAEVRIGPVLQPQSDINDTTWMIMERLSELTGFALPELQLADRRRKGRRRLARRRLRPAK